MREKTKRVGDCMGRLVDLTGRKFDRLTVLSRGKNSNTGCARWVCRCDCGKTVVVLGGSLTGGKTHSCGCYRNENSANKATKHGKHELKIYGVWSSMKGRCFCESNKSYKNYGGRGITVCDEWMEFQGFYEWSLTSGYSEGLTIERIDVNGDYCPENCKWATRLEQAHNKRNNKFIEYNGEKKCYSEWAHELGGTDGLVSQRIKKGWEVKDAVTEPIIDPYLGEQITINGVTKNKGQWAKEMGIHRTTLNSRIKKGWDIEKAITTPAGKQGRRRKNNG